ncbi:MAG TPA: DoxX family membrane protein [Bacteroidia bacterium]|nr:DoxX family membrane protein [Bacteroidia bacterium]
MENQLIAAFIARIFLGFLFLFQGYDALFNVRISNIITTYSHEFANKGIPKGFTIAGVWFTSWVEFIGGILLILGLFQNYTLYFLGLDLILASVAFGIDKPMWDMRYVFPRLVILIFLLLIPSSWNCISLDYLIQL